MNPHRLTWGFAYDMPNAQIIAGVLMISLIINGEIKKIPVDSLLIVWICFLIWISITTFFAVHPDAAFNYYDRAIKIQLLTFLTLMCMTTQKRVDLLIWVICLSIGFYSIKGSVFTILTAGQYRVYGPPNSFIEENNALAVAVLMVIPLMWYLREISERKWVKNGLSGAMLLSGISVLGSQSRGAFVAMVALAGYFWLQTRTKLISSMLIVILAVASITFMPDSWYERMDSIRNYEEDLSAMGRINAWKFSINIANDRFTGGGFNPFSPNTYARYNPAADTALVAHSIYFSVLAAHGWPGLIMFLLILAMTWRNLSKAVKFTNKDPSLKRQNVLARMLRLSLIAYMSGGVFLSLAYFDLPWHIIAIAYLQKWQLAELKEASEMGNPAHPRQSRLTN